MTSNIALLFSSFYGEMHDFLTPPSWLVYLVFGHGDFKETLNEDYHQHMLSHNWRCHADVPQSLKKCSFYALFTDSIFLITALFL